MRIRRPGDIANDRRQVEFQYALVLGALQAVGPQAHRLCIRFDQLHLLIRAAGQFQVVERLLVDRKHRRRRAILGRHVGYGCAVAERQTGRTFAEELEVRRHDLLFAQKLGQCQHDVGGRDSRLALAAQLDTDDVR